MELIKYIGKEIDMAAIINNKNLPAISKIRKEEGEAVLQNILKIAIRDLLTGLPFELEPAGLSKLIQYIIEDYYFFKIADIYAISKRIAKKKIFGKLYINDVLAEFEAYSNERLQLGAEISRKEAAERKKQIDLLTDEQLKKLYKKVGASVSKLEYNKRLRAINEQKKRKLKQIYYESSKGNKTGKKTN